MRSDYVQPFSYDSGLSNPKTQCQFTRELFHVTNNTAQSYYVEKMQDFFSKAYQQQRNVLLSTEDLSAIPVEGIKYLRNMLVNFKAKIVMIFRDSLSRTLSNYRQLYSLNKLSNNIPHSDFKTYVEHFVTTKSLQKYYPHMLERYANQFGIENIIVIDYYGAVEAKKDLTYIILYEVGQIPCEDCLPIIKNSTSNTAEHHTTLLLSGVISEIRNRMIKRKCNIPKVNNDKLLIRIISKLIGNQTLPSITTYLKNVYFNDTIYGDDEFREKYKNLILYNNRNASIQAVEKQVLVELDFHQFRHDSHWQKWVHHVTSRLSNRSSIIICPHHINKMPPKRHVVIVAKNRSSDSSKVIIVIEKSKNDTKNSIHNYINDNKNDNNKKSTNDNNAISKYYNSPQQSSQQDVEISLQGRYTPINLQTSMVLLVMLIFLFIILPILVAIVHCVISIASPTPASL